MGAAYKYENGEPEHSFIGKRKMILESLHYYPNKYTPNAFLKFIRRKDMVHSIVEKGQEWAYLDELDKFYSQVLKLLRTDNKDPFSILIKANHGLIKAFPPLGLFEDVCKHCAVGCATVFLQSGFSLDLNNEFENSNYRPLDYGALHSSPALTQLLLQYGANPDNQSYYGFPLDIALNNLCHHELVKQWTPEISVYRLLNILCMPELKEALATIKLLASHMKHVEKVYGDLIARGHVHKLASLLMAAKDQLLVPSGQGGAETTPVGEYILKRLRPESEQENQVLTDSENTSLDQSKPVVELLNNAYDVVKIMWKSADIVSHYFNSERSKEAPNYEVPFDNAHDLVNDAELDMNPEDVFNDDNKCLRSLVTLEAEVPSKQICFQKQLCHNSSLHPIVSIRERGPITEEGTKISLFTLHYYRNRYTPNALLKFARHNGVLPDIVEKGEEWAYLDEFDNLYCQAQMFLKTDNKDRFAILIETYRDLIEKFPPLGLFEDVCKHGAVACATVFLQSGFCLDLNNEFENSNYRPLDYGALHSSPALTQLLLQYGANPDNESYYGFSLDIALNNLCHHEFVKQWTPEKSIFKLLYILCLPELKEALATIKLLASHMKHVEKVYGDLIARGHVHKLASLLMAAKDQLLVPSGQGGPETTPVGEYILKRLRPESEQENQVLTDSECTMIDQSKPDLELLNNAYNVVNIMWKAADILNIYHNSDWTKEVLNYEVPFDIAHDLVNDAELVMNPKDVYSDDIKCLRPPVTVTLEAEALSKRICFQKQLRHNPSLHPLVSIKYPEMGKQSLFSSLCMPRPPCNSYHTWQAVNFNNVRPAPSMGKGLGTDMPQFRHRTWQAVNFNINKLVELQTTPIKPSLCNVIASRISAIIWIAKRSIK